MPEFSPAMEVTGIVAVIMDVTARKRIEQVPNLHFIQIDRRGLIGFAGRAGRIARKAILMDLFAGVDNAFDVTYSLGNDINATGGRYFNAAPGVNYYGGVSFRYQFQNK